MKWPWVSRARLDAAERQAEAFRREAVQALVRVDAAASKSEMLERWFNDMQIERNQWREWCRESENRHDALIRDLTKKPDPVTYPAPPDHEPVVIPPELNSAIAKMTSPHTKDRRALEAEVRQRLEEGQPESEILSAVLYGQEVEL